MAAVVNAVHACDAALGCDAWFEWVPSKANVSDLPSREASTWDSSDAAFMARLRARSAFGCLSTESWCCLWRPSWITRPRCFIARAGSPDLYMYILCSRGYAALLRPCGLPGSSRPAGPWGFAAPFGALCWMRLLGWTCVSQDLRTYSEVALALSWLSCRVPVD